MAACADMHDAATARPNGRLRRTRRARSLQIAVLSLTGLLTVAWSSSWDSIRQAAGGIQSVRADFTQEKHLQILAEPLVSEGRLLFAAPDRLRWEYTSPLPSVLLMDGSRVQRFVRTGATWTEDASAALPAMSFVMQEISRWMSGRFDENPDFEARLAPGGRIVLTPRKETLATVIQKIDLQLSATPGVIETVSVYEDDRNFTRLVFTQVQVNAPIDPARFRQIS